MQIPFWLEIKMQALTECVGPGPPAFTGREFELRIFVDGSPFAGPPASTGREFGLRFYVDGLPSADIRNSNCGFASAGSPALSRDPPSHPGEFSWVNLGEFECVGGASECVGRLVYARQGVVM